MKLAFGNNKSSAAVSYTRFMNNYRSSSVLHTGSNLSVVSVDDFGSVIFTTDDSSQLHCYTEKDTSSTGVSEYSIKGQAKRMTAFRKKDGKIALLTSAADTLFYIEEKEVNSRRFYEPKQIHFPTYSDIKEIERFYTKVTDDGVIVAFMTSCYGSDSMLLYYTIIKDGEPQVIRTDMSYSSLYGCIIGNNSNNAGFASFNGVATSYCFKSAKLTRYTSSQPIYFDKPISININNEKEVIIGISRTEKSDIYSIILENESQTYKKYKLSDNNNFMDLTAINCKGDIHILGISYDEKLYHSCIGSSYDIVQNFIEIASNIRVLSVDKAHQDGYNCYAIGSTQNLLGDFNYNYYNTNWFCEWLELSNDTVISKFDSYSTEITICDSSNHPLVATPISINASNLAKLDMRGGIHWVDKNNDFKTVTDLHGKITIIQETNNLVTSDLYINVKGFMDKNDKIVIKPYSEVENKLNTLTPNELKNAKKTDGYLVDEKYRNDNQLMKSITDALNSVTNVSKSQYMTIHNGRMPMKFSTPDFKGWSIKFMNGTAIYKELDDISLEAKIADIKNNCVDAGFRGFFSKIGDFFRSVVNKVVEVVEIVVHKVNEIVKSVISFISEGVKYFFETIVEFIEDVMDIAEIIFTKIEVFFKDLFEWLAFIFNWNDILRTKEILKYLVNEGLVFLDGAAEGINRIVIGKLRDFEKSVDEIFDYAVDSFFGKYSYNNCFETNVPEDENIALANSNNFLMDKLLQNSKYITTDNKLLVDNNLSDIVNELIELMENCSKSDEMDEALRYFKNASSDKDNFFNSIIAGTLRALQALFKLAIDGVIVVFDKLFKIISDILQLIKNLINKSVKIPFINEFYKFISGGSDMSFADVLCLITAVPTTILYKIIYNKPLFSDDASVKAFKNDVNAQKWLQASGLVENKLISNMNLTVSEQSQTFCKVFGSVGVFWFFSLSTISDTGSGTIPICVFQILTELLWQACTCPWIFDETSIENSEKPSEKILWIFLWFGVIGDTAWTIATSKYPDSEDCGRLYTTYYGLYHLAFIIPTFFESSGTTIAGNCINVIVEIMKFLALKELVASTEGISLAIVCISDFISAVSLGILGMF